MCHWSEAELPELKYILSRCARQYAEGFPSKREKTDCTE